MPKCVEVLAISITFVQSPSLAPNVSHHCKAFSFPFSMAFLPFEFIAACVEVSVWTCTGVFMITDVCSVFLPPILSRNTEIEKK